MTHVRFLLVRVGCPYCKMYLGAIEEFNARVRPTKQIDVLDVTLYEDYGIVTDARIPRIPYKGTPTLYVDGFMTTNSPTSVDYVYSLLDAIFDEDGEIKTYDLEEEYGEDEIE